MTKYNTVPTNRSDNMGNIVTEMVPWGTSAVFGELKLNIVTEMVTWGTSAVLGELKLLLIIKLHNVRFI